MFADSLFATYLDTIGRSRFDQFILGLGALLAAAQAWFLAGSYLSGAARYRTELGRWQRFFLMIVEVFPFLGILGTVLALSGTLGIIAAHGNERFDVVQVVGRFAPAISTTASGIIAALVNLLINTLLAFRADREIQRLERSYARGAGAGAESRPYGLNEPPPPLGGRAGVGGTGAGAESRPDGGIEGPGVRVPGPAAEGEP